VTMCGEVQVPEHHLEVRKNKWLVILDQSPTIYLFVSCQGKRRRYVLKGRFLSVDVSVES
jgi:hypothetical protein